MAGAGPAAQLSDSALGSDVEAVAWAVWTFDSDGLVTRAEAFLVENEAVEAVGLDE